MSRHTSLCWGLGAGRRRFMWAYSASVQAFCFDAHFSRTSAGHPTNKIASYRRSLFRDREINSVLGSRNFSAEKIILIFPIKIIHQCEGNRVRMQLEPHLEDRSRRKCQNRSEFRWVVNHNNVTDNNPILARKTVKLKRP